MDLWFSPCPFQCQEPKTAFPQNEATPPPAGSALRNYRLEQI